MNQLPSFLCGHPDLELAAKAALSAGTIVANGYHQVHRINSKEVGDLVSQIDIDADHAATDVLSTDPNQLPILSEELSPNIESETSSMWIVDPLDGSTAYLMDAGRQYSSVLIAQRKNGKTELGVAYFPLTGEWFYAVSGKGAFKNGEPLKIKQRRRLLHNCWVEMNQYGNVDYETPFFTATRNALRSPNGAQIVTSTFPHAGVAMRIAEQASGLAAAIHDNNPRSLKQGPWDIAAIQLIFEEAGGVFVNPDGERTNCFVAEPIIIAVNHHLAEQITSLVNVGHKI